MSKRCMDCVWSREITYTKDWDGEDTIKCKCDLDKVKLPPSDTIGYYADVIWDCDYEGKASTLAGKLREMRAI